MSTVQIDCPIWRAIMADDRLASARRRLSFHEIRLIIQHASRDPEAAKPITSRELIERCGQDPDEPLGRIEFPSEMRRRGDEGEAAKLEMHTTIGPARWIADLREARADNQRLIEALGSYPNPGSPEYFNAADFWPRFEEWAANALPLLANRPSTAPEAAKLEEMREALTPSAETKAAYIGEFTFTDWRTDENGDEQGHEMTVPWTTIKEIMAAIRNRADAALTGAKP